MTTPASGHTVPSAVARQVAAANEAIAALQNLNGQPQPGAAPVAPVAQQPPVQLNVAPPVQQPQRAAAPPPPNPAVAAAPPEDDLREQLRRSEARFSTLQGKYNAETTAMREQLAQNTALVTQLLERDARPPVAPAAPQTPEERVRALGATDKEIEEYGDLLPLVARLAENMVRPTIEKLNSELARVQQSQVSVAQTAHKTSVAAFESHLDNVIPTWRLINEDENFLDWLNVLDIFAGVTRRVALTDAYKKLDAARVAAIFQAYAREYPQQARAPGAPQVDPATLVAPEVRGGPPAAPEGQGGKRLISETEIQDFYAKVRKKQVSAEAYAAFMQEIARASAEGRIVPTRRMRHANEAF